MRLLAARNVRVDHVIEEWRVFLPYLVLFVDELLFDDFLCFLLVFQGV